MHMPWRSRQIARAAHVAGVAGLIWDPVVRLRFLRAVAPHSPFRRRRLHRSIPWIGLALLLLVPFLMKLRAGKPEALSIAPAPLHEGPAHPDPATASVWQVEQTADSEVYSNGLRIDTRFTVGNLPRAYTAFQRQGHTAVKRVCRSQPAGILYHTTESCTAPFEPEDTPVLKRLGESVLEYVRRHRAYHYVIDRFGRVFREVAESSTAYHAGHSVWADDEWFYINLNESFLGVAFEAQTHAAQAGGIISPAQIRAAAMLTEMLRSRYRIRAENCVTHAQVSVNPANMLVGYHTDWASGFPFAELGLPDNYQQALPSLWAFGFDYEPAWLAAGGDRMAIGVKRAEREIAFRAAAASMRPTAYRKALRGQYRAWLAEVRHGFSSAVANP